MAPPSGDPKKMWKLSFAEIFGFPLPRQLEYMIISSVQSLIAQSEVIRDAFLNNQGSGGDIQVDRNFSNKELVQQLQDYYWSLSVGFEELLGVPFANLEQNMRDVPDILDRLRIARKAAISDMQTLASIADGSMEVAPKKGQHRADRHERTASGQINVDPLRRENPSDRYRPDRHGRRGMIDTRGESSSTVLENARNRRPNRPDQHRHRDVHAIDDAHGDSSQIETPGRRAERRRGQSRNESPGTFDPIEPRIRRILEEQPITTNTARTRPHDHQHPDRDPINRPEPSTVNNGEDSQRRTGKQRADRVPQRDISPSGGGQAVLDAATQASQALAERLQLADQKKWQKRMEEQSRKLAEEIQADDHRKAQKEAEKKSRKLAQELQAEEERNAENETAELMAEAGTAIGERSRRRYQWQPGDNDGAHRGADSGHRRDRDRRETGQGEQSPIAGSPQLNPTRRQRVRREATPEQSVPAVIPPPGNAPPRRRRRSITDL